MRGEGALRANNKIQVAHGNLELGEASGGGLVRMGTREEVREPPRPTSPKDRGAVTLRHGPGRATTSTDEHRVSNLSKPPRAAPPSLPAPRGYARAPRDDTHLICGGVPLSGGVRGGKPVKKTGQYVVVATDASYDEVQGSRRQ